MSSESCTVAIAVALTSLACSGGGFQYEAGDEASGEMDFAAGTVADPSGTTDIPVTAADLPGLLAPDGSKIPMEELLQIKIGEGPLDERSEDGTVLGTLRQPLSDGFTTLPSIGFVHSFRPTTTIGGSGVFGPAVVIYAVWGVVGHNINNLYFAYFLEDNPSQAFVSLGIGQGTGTATGWHTCPANTVAAGYNYSSFRAIENDGNLEKFGLICRPLSGSGSDTFLPIFGNPMALFTDSHTCGNGGLFTGYRAQGAASSGGGVNFFEGRCRLNETSF